MSGACEDAQLRADLGERGDGPIEVRLGVGGGDLDPNACLAPWEPRGS